jgi:hypothetical protein
VWYIGGILIIDAEKNPFIFGQVLRVLLCWNS